LHPSVEETFINCAQALQLYNIDLLVKIVD
jgi:hypothetical protein